MNSRFVKMLALTLVMVLCCTAMIGCKGKKIDPTLTPDESQDAALYPTKPSVPEDQTVATVPVLTESNLDWSIFTAVGLSADEAKTVFMKLGFADLSEPEDNGNDSFTVYPYGVKETPLLVKVADGKITQVVLSNLHVEDGAKNAYHNDGALPATWYVKGDKGYKSGPQNTLTVLLYDTDKGENPYVAGVDWKAKKLIYF